MIVTRQLVDRADDFVRSGAAVVIVTAVGRVDGARCDRLVKLPGVTASGALRETSYQLTPVALRSAPIPVSEISPGFPDVVQASTRTAGLLLGPEAIEALGLVPPSPLATSAGPLRVGGHYAYPNDGRRPGLSYAALAPAPVEQPFDECWVETRPAKEVTSPLLTTVLFGGDGGDPPTTAQLNPTRGTSFDGQVLFAARLTRFAGPCAAFLGFALGFASVRSRRLSFASALHATASHSDLWRIVGLETLAWVILSAAFVLPITVVIGASLDGGGASLVEGLRVALPFWLTGYLGAWSGLATIHERSLFRYFKTR